jgi:hypothetical protein
MSDPQRPAEFQFPVPRVIGLAALACLVSLTFIYWAAPPAVHLLESGWDRLLLYAPFPMLVTFIILYRGNWHREKTGVARLISLLLLSGLILAGVVFAIGVAVAIVGFSSMAMRAGAGGR